MKALRYFVLTLILVVPAFLFSGPATAADIDATLPDSDNTSSFQVKNSESSNNVLMKVQSGGNMGIGTTSPEEKLDVNGNVQIRGTNGKLVFPSLHYDAKIELFKNGDEKIGTSDNQLKLIAGGGTTDNIAFFGDSTEVMRVETGSGNVGIGTTSPKATLHINGSLALTYKQVSFAAGSPYEYTVLDTDLIIGINALGQNARIILPLAGPDNVGRIITIKDETGTAAGSYMVEIAPTGSQSIDEYSVSNPGYLVSADAWGFVRVYSNGSNWHIIGGGLGQY